jgi:type VI secretion system protein ImpL
LKNRRLVLAIGFILLLLLIWFAGPMVGLKSVPVRSLTAGLAVMTGIVVILLNKIRASKGAALIENAIEEEAVTQLASARPDRKDEIAALRDQLNAAIATLKKSKMGKFRWGKSALYELPWYMIIGPPASGKSTAIRHSGLNFPHVSEEGRGIQGIGGTRNCDWWFTNQAVLLDTAGRYTTEEEDKEEWLAFLDMLKKGRKRKPINGILVGVSVADLLNADEEGIQWHAKNIRKRIDELFQRLNVTFPIYVVFTKCDLLQGFVEFFGDMNTEERAQVWGGTLNEEELKQGKAETIFEQEFDLLQRSLDHRRLSRLGAETKMQSKQSVYFFPLQFQSLKNKLSAFVKDLFEPNPYQQNPFFRGFYFTSGTQEGTPIDNVIGAMSKAFGLSGDISSMLGAAQETKSYFIKDLFLKVIFPDQHIAGLSTGAARRGRVVRKLAFAASLAVLAVLGTGLVFSFTGNKRLLSATTKSAQSVHQIQWRDGKQFGTNLKTMDALRGRLVKLDRYGSKQPTAMLRWGLYRGHVVSDPSRQVYFDRYSELLLHPMGQEVESELSRLSSKGRISQEEFPYFYNILKAYLMMGDPAKGDPEFMEAMFSAVMDEQETFREHPDIRQVVERQNAYYLEHLDTGKAPALALQKELVADARRTLQGVPLLELAYLKIREAGSKHFEPYTLEKALQSRRQNVLYSKYKVPGIFTPQGWNDYFKEASVKASEETLKEDWILGDLAKNLAGGREGKAFVVEGLRDLYMRDYVKEWRSFVGAVHVRTFRNMEDAVDRLHVLTENDSPFIRLFQAVAKQTEIEKKPILKTTEEAAGLFDRAKRKLGVSGKVKVKVKLPEAPDNFVEKNYRPLHDFVEGRGSGKEQQIAELQNYIGLLAKIGDMLNSISTTDYPQREAKDLAENIMSRSSGSELHEALSTINDMMRDMDVESRRVVEPLLKEPILYTLSTVLQNAGEYLDQLWQDEVYEPYQGNLQSRYPFSPAGPDATLIDVAEFYHPTDGVFRRFVTHQLKNFLEAAGRDSWRAKTWQGQGIKFSRGFLTSLEQISKISECLFPKGSTDPRASFSLYPYPTPGLSEIRILVDDQDYRYRMGPQVDKEFSWPAQAGLTGAKLSILDEKSGFRDDKSFKGPWGFFRLLDAGRVTQQSSTKYQLTWAFDSSQAKRYEVNFRLKARSTKNPFLPGLFRNFRCPSRISGPLEQTS